MSLVHLHLALTHVPVVGLVVVLGLLLWALVRRSSEVARAGLAALVLIACATGLVFLTGEPAEEAVEELAGITEASIDRHKELAQAALAVTMGLGVLSLAAFGRFLRRDVPRWAIATLFVLTLGASGLMAVTANLGCGAAGRNTRRRFPPASRDSHSASWAARFLR